VVHSLAEIFAKGFFRCDLTDDIDLSDAMAGMEASEGEHPETLYGGRLDLHIVQQALGHAPLPSHLCGLTSWR
jgi:hypothetical protein